MWLFYFNFERKYDLLKTKSPCILLNKNINFNKNETELKMEYRTHSLETQTLCFSSYKNLRLKVKLWWVAAHKRKKEGIFCIVYFVRRSLFNVSILTQCILYWIYVQNIHTFTYQNILLYRLFCLFLKLPKAFSASLSLFVSAAENFGFAVPFYLICWWT